MLLPFVGNVDHAPSGISATAESSSAVAKFHVICPSCRAPIPSLLEDAATLSWLFSSCDVNGPY